MEIKALYCHQNLLSIGLSLYHNLGLDNGLKFRWQYKFLYLGPTLLYHVSISADRLLACTKVF